MKPEDETMSLVLRHEFETAAELLELIDELGGIPPSRLLLKPTPGEATEADLLDRMDRTGKTCELIDGVLVEKAMGRGEAFIAARITILLGMYTMPRSLGHFISADGIVRLRPGVVRAPDVSFIRSDRLPNGQADMTPIGELIPDLAIEVISAGNTKAEIARKIGEYFLAGVEAVWVVDPVRRVVVVHTSAADAVTLAETDTLEGGPVFPGLDLPLARIFEIVPRRRSDNGGSVAIREVRVCQGDDSCQQS
jgi:Uma2 family endonuclease